MSSEPFDFVNRANAEYIDQLHEQYPLAIRAQFPSNGGAFFAGFEVGLPQQAHDGAPWRCQPARSTWACSIWRIFTANWATSSRTSIRSAMIGPTIHCWI